MIETADLVKRYGQATALDGLSLNVPAGVIYGLIGQNGAGKTTAMRILTTLLAPTSGLATIAGIDVVAHPDAVRPLVGYMPDFFGLYDDLNVSEYLLFYAALYGITGKPCRNRIDGLLELFRLGDRRESPCESLSRGMQQRLCLARTLIHDPPVLFLDEPASGMDPVARVELRNILIELQRRGKTIVISSHILSELGELCSHAGIVSGGRIVRQGTIQEVARGAEAAQFEIRVLREVDVAVAALGTVPDIGNLVISGTTVRFVTRRDAEGASEALAAIVSAGVPVAEFRRLDSSLEASVVQAIRGALA